MIVIKAAWEKEVSTWLATSADVPGLNVCGATMEKLIAALEEMLSILLELNKHPVITKEFEVRIVSHAALFK